MSSRCCNAGSAIRSSCNKNISTIINCNICYIITIATAIVCSSFQLEPTCRVSGFFVRKNTKDYGLEKTVEGIVQNPVAVVDDVITTGKSVLQAVSALRNQGICEINIVSVIDRETEENLLNQNKTQFHSIFRHSEFADYIDSKLDQ